MKREKKRAKKLAKFQAGREGGVASKDELALLVEDDAKRGEFVGNPEDDRFSAMRTKAAFAVDPTHKDYRKLGKGFVSK